eukprot:gene26835-4433_t
MLLCGGNLGDNEMLASMLLGLMEGAQMRTCHLPGCLMRGHGDAVEGMVQILAELASRIRPGASPVVLYLPNFESWAVVPSDEDETDLGNLAGALSRTDAPPTLLSRAGPRAQAEASGVVVGSEVEQESCGSMVHSLTYKASGPPRCKSMHPHSSTFGGWGPSLGGLSPSLGGLDPSLGGRGPSLEGQGPSLGGLSPSHVGEASVSARGLGSNVEAEDAEGEEDEKDEESNEDGESDGGESMPGLSLSPLWTVFEQAFKQLPAHCPVVLLATSQADPEAFPHQLLSFFNGFTPREQLPPLPLQQQQQQQLPGVYLVQISDDKRLTLEAAERAAVWALAGITPHVKASGGGLEGEGGPALPRIVQSPPSGGREPGNILERTETDTRTRFLPGPASRSDMMEGAAVQSGTDRSGPQYVGSSPSTGKERGSGFRDRGRDSPLGSQSFDCKQRDQADTSLATDPCQAGGVADTCMWDELNGADRSAALKILSAVQSCIRNIGATMVRDQGCQNARVAMRAYQAASWAASLEQSGPNALCYLPEQILVLPRPVQGPPLGLQSPSQVGAAGGGPAHRGLTGSRLQQLERDQVVAMSLSALGEHALLGGYQQLEELREAVRSGAACIAAFDAGRRVGEHSHMNPYRDVLEQDDEDLIQPTYSAATSEAWQWVDNVEVACHLAAESLKLHDPTNARLLTAAVQYQGRLAKAPPSGGTPLPSLREGGSLDNPRRQVVVSPQTPVEAGGPNQAQGSGGLRPGQGLGFPPARMKSDALAHEAGLGGHASDGLGAGRQLEAGKKVEAERKLTMRLVKHLVPLLEEWERQMCPVLCTAFLEQLDAELPLPSVLDRTARKLAQKLTVKWVSGGLDLPPSLGVLGVEGVEEGGVDVPMVADVVQKVAAALVSAASKHL